MRMTTIKDKEIKMEDISHRFICFPQFREDYPILFESGIIKRVAFDHYEWTKSKTSLAEYFKWIGGDAWCVPGGFWKPVETVFKVSRRTLSKLASRYNNPKAHKNLRENSPDYEDIKVLVLSFREKCRQQRQQDQKDREAFNLIKNLIEETESEDINKIRATLKRVKDILD